MDRRLVLFFFSFLSVFLVTSSLAGAIGVSPARYDLQFTPGFENDFSFSVINNQDNEITVELSLRRDMAGFASLSTDEITIPARGKGPFTVHMALPDDAQEMEHPGRNILEILIMEQSDNEGSGIGSKTGVVPWVVVNVPYPKRYAEIRSFGTSSTNVGGNLSLSFIIENKGNETLRGTSAVVKLLDDENKVIDSQEFSDITLLFKGQYQQELMFRTDRLPAQDYSSVLEYTYDANTITKNVSFRIGTLDARILAHQENLTKGGIVPFTVEVASNWKGETYISGTIGIGDYVAETPRIYLDEFKAGTLTAYIDTDRLEPGMYEASIDLLIEDKNTGEENEVSDTISVAVLEHHEPEEESVWNPLALGVIALAVALLIIILFVLLSHRRKAVKK